MSLDPMRSIVSLVMAWSRSLGRCLLLMNPSFHDFHSPLAFQSDFYDISRVDVT